MWAGAPSPAAAIRGCAIGGTLAAAAVIAGLALATACSRPPRLVGNGIHLDLGADDGARLDRGAGQNRVLEVLREHLVVTPEIAGILEIGGHPDDIGQARAVLRQDPLDRFDRAGGLLLDRSGDHVAVGILGDLTRYEDEVPRAHRRVERQIGVLFSDRVDVAASAVAHLDLIWTLHSSGFGSQPIAGDSMTSMPLM